MHQPSRRSEPIPGYVLTERIGVGGYGEVWSAQAPGGLTKAIKFVYGYFDDSRGSRELKALDRIKQVRHPFLLSLERFEIVDGQLIIVTELADLSLKDRFEQAKESGAGGIPRDDLLNYLRDAADALDYMSENFSLQHLDVKPENLLLVGGRMKVADFGLVKNLHDVAASMMGGLTPIYAAPEVFDDRPSSYSDQYSLAIVYQEMLTGHLPFPGRTPAQLASQHLHASPRLSTLPPADQLIIAQALAKNPVERFPNSRALVDALVEANLPKRNGTATAPRRRDFEFSSTSDTASVKSQAVNSDTDSRTQILGADGSARLGQAQAIPVEPIVDLGPLELPAEAAALRPTLYIGIGGTAGRVLRRLRRRLDDRFGTAAAVPAIEMLLVDTDARCLFAAGKGDREVSLPDRQLMALPLRSAREYTADARNMMQWLSRRWLYSIPRSLQTEGRRPLGRLALVDHAPQLLERIRAALGAITAAEPVAASAAASGMPWSADQPRVVIIASISGGTGGGMALDVAYAVRQILASHGRPDDGVCQLFMHSTDRNPTTAELATANAYAFLTELQHYNCLGYNAGDTACGLPLPPADGGCLANTYLVHLGHGLNDLEFDAAIDEVAAYAYLATATAAAGAIDRFRAAGTDNEDGAALRSFSLCTLGGAHTALPGLAAELVCRAVLERWRGTRKDRRESASKSSIVDMATQRSAPAGIPTATELANRADEHAAALELAIEPLQAIVAGRVEHQLGGGAEAVLQRLNATVDPPAPAHQRARLLSEAVRGLFDPTAVSDDGQKPPAVELLGALDDALKPIAAPKSAAIADWILEFVNDPAHRVAGALQAKACYVNRLRGLETECGELLNDVHDRLQVCQQMLAEAAKTPPARRRLFGARRAEARLAAEVERVLLLSVELRIEECTLYGVNRLVRLIGSGVSSAGDTIKEVQHQLGQWIAQFGDAQPWDDAAAGSETTDVFEEVRTAATRNLRQRIPELEAVIDASFQSRFLAEHGGLLAVSQRADAVQTVLVDALRDTTRAAVLEALRQFPLGVAVFTAETPTDDRPPRLQACLEKARSKFTDCGGAQRLLAVLPSGCAESHPVDDVAQRFTPPATVVFDAGAELVLCYEQQQLSLAHVAARLIDGRNDVIQVAGRLHTRVDIPWSQLPQPLDVHAACSAH